MCAIVAEDAGVVDTAVSLAATRSAEADEPSTEYADEYDAVATEYSDERCAAKVEALTWSDDNCAESETLMVATAAVNVE